MSDGKGVIDVNRITCGGDRRGIIRVDYIERE